MKLILSGSLESISTRNDGTIKFIVGTQELDPSQAGNLFHLRNKFIKVLLSDSNITAIEENFVDAEEIKDAQKRKTQSQRLRAVMFKVHETKKIGQDFDPWYKTEMERLIESYKAILNEE